MEKRSSLSLKMLTSETINTMTKYEGCNYKRFYKSILFKLIYLVVCSGTLCQGVILG